MSEPKKMRQSSHKEASTGSNPTNDAKYFETVIIGTGFSGLLAAIGLQKKNSNDFVLLERLKKMPVIDSFPGSKAEEQ